MMRNEKETQPITFRKSYKLAFEGRSPLSFQEEVFTAPSLNFEDDPYEVPILDFKGRNKNLN